MTYCYRPIPRRRSAVGLAVGRNADGEPNAECDAAEPRDYVIEKRRRTTLTFPASSSTILCVAPAGSLPCSSNRAASPEAITVSRYAAFSLGVGCSLVLEVGDSGAALAVAFLFAAVLRFLVVAAPLVLVFLLPAVSRALADLVTVHTTSGPHCT